MILSRMRAQEARDDGFTMIIVLGFTLVLTLIAAVVFAIVGGSLKSSSAHVSYDTALNVAESGIDQTLARLNKTKTYNVGSAAPAGFASESAERSWARGQLTALAQTYAANGTPFPSVNGGEYVTIRPANRKVVYAMSFIPTYARVKKSRLLKAEYIFSPYKPGNALLTNGDICFSGSVVVNALDGSTPAPVHTNADIYGTCGGGSGAAGSLSISGDVTSTGSYNIGSGASVGSGSKGAEPVQKLPDLGPRSFYETNAPLYTYTTTTPTYDGSWYDLCPNGDVRPPSSTLVPCSNSTVLASTSYRGWSFTAASGSTPPTWTMTDPSYGGMYYVFQGDGYMNTASNAPYWNGTVVAEAAVPSASSPCNKSGGNISFKTVNIKAFVPGIVMLAGADLGRLGGGSGNKISNSDVGDGLFGAADQVYLDTSSTTITGAVVAGDSCPADSLGRSSVQGVTLRYDQTTEIPVSDVVRTTEWLEYVGS